jgi:DNA processing protein
LTPEKQLAKRLSFTAEHLMHSAITRSVEAAHSIGREEGFQNRLNLLADVAWSVISEPGDTFVSYLRQTIGLPNALALLVERSDLALWLGQLRMCDHAQLGDDTFVDLAATLSEAIERYMTRVSLSNIMAKLDHAQKLGLHLINREHSDWPIHLDALDLGAPVMLWARGNSSVLRNSAHSVALVGSRTPTQYGEDVTTTLVQGLADENFAIVSGGAFGIDATAHRCALIVDTPTVAVMAGGVDQLYPRSNTSLFERITDRGAVISEVSLGTAPAKWRFLQRNRLIAALSAATVVVEAGFRSGAINTANHALAIERPVGAVPGSILSPRSSGCHKLIADGKATIVSSADDVIGLAASGTMAEVSTIESLPPLETRVLDAIGFGVITKEQICAIAGVTNSEATLALASLELRSRIDQTAGKIKRR